MLWRHAENKLDMLEMSSKDHVVGGGIILVGITEGPLPTAMQIFLLHIKGPPDPICSQSTRTHSLNLWPEDSRRRSPGSLVHLNLRNQRERVGDG